MTYPKGVTFMAVKGRPPGSRNGVSAWYDQMTEEERAVFNDAMARAKAAESDRKTALEVVRELRNRCFARIHSIRRKQKEGDQ